MLVTVPAGQATVCAPFVLSLHAAVVLFISMALWGGCDEWIVREDCTTHLTVRTA